MLTASALEYNTRCIGPTEKLSGRPCLSGEPYHPNKNSFYGLEPKYSFAEEVDLRVYLIPIYLQIDVEAMDIEDLITKSVETKTGGLEGYVNATLCEGSVRYYKP